MSLDRLLAAWVSAHIEGARLLGARQPAGAAPFVPPLRLLFAGYNGARNTGSDVRTREAIRQILHVLGPGNVRATVLTQDPRLTRGYFDGAIERRVPDVFPGFIAREVQRHDGVIACEGSMFTSTFANALSAFMIEALGMAAAGGRLSVGYGAEAGRMDPILRAMCRRYCAQSLIITRSGESRAILDGLGVPTAPGTDTAWTFEPHPPEYGADILRLAGWNERDEVLLVCPTNPFWWPVKASVGRTLAWGATGAYARSHYRSVYFHRTGRAVDRAYHAYLDGIATAVAAFRRDHRVFLGLVAMEALDTDACLRLADRLGGAAVFSSRDHDMFALVSVLRRASLLVSSRYHAIVTTMPALVPSAGIATDERIRNLMADRGHDHLRVDCTDPELAGKLVAILQALTRSREDIRAGIARATLVHLERMAGMGSILLRLVRDRVPAFPEPQRTGHWTALLPPLDPLLSTLLDRRAS